MQKIEIVEADLDRPEHQHAILDLTDAYARDPMGNGKPLSAEVRGALIPGLRHHPTTVIFLAYLGNNAIGIANCFIGFSTFVFTAESQRTQRGFTFNFLLRGQIVKKTCLSGNRIESYIHPVPQKKFSGL